MSQGRADGIFAVAKLVKVICLTKFYDFFLCINPFYRLFSGFFGCFLGVEVTQLLIIPIIFSVSSSVNTGDIGSESSHECMCSVTGRLSLSHSR